MIKMYGKTNFLVIRIAINGQQKLFHRNHRNNLLILCHPFRPNQYLRTNNAQCSILLNGVGNKKLILIHSRGLRHNVGGSGTETKEEKEDKDSSSTTTDTETPDENEIKKMDAEQLESKFKSKFSKFYIKFREDVGARNVHMRDLSFTRKQFVDKFNEEHAKSGFKIEGSENNLDGETIAQFMVLLPLFMLITIIWMFPPRGSVKHEHAQIMATQPPITFHQFAQDYLPSGEIDIIFHYPTHNIAIALLHPGAVINGEPFTGPGVHVQLDESFRHFPMTFSQRVREEERRIGVRETVPIDIRQVDFSSLVFYILGTLFLSLFIGRHIARFLVIQIQIRLFRAVPINSKEGKVVTKPKE